MKPKRRERSDIMLVGVYDVRVEEPPALKTASELQKSAYSDMRPTKCGRFARPCGFQSPAINSLPAERSYRDILYIRYFGIMPGYCATLKTRSSFSLNAAISCLILSLVILA